MASSIPSAILVNAVKSVSGTTARKRVPKSEVIRGKEVAVRESSSAMEIIYGRMKTGGVITFIETSSDSKAYLTTGSSGNQDELVWTAQTAGTGGNAITVRIVVSGTNPTLSVSVSGNDITVTCKSTGGVSESTATQVIAAVQASGAANALVRVQRGNQTVNGNVQAVGQTNLAYGGGTWLHMVLTLAGHYIDGSDIETLYLDNTAVTFGGAPDGRWSTNFGGRVFKAFIQGDDNQGAQGDLTNQLPTSWTSNHRQRGCGGLYLILIWDQNVFPEGLPDISVLMRGKPCYDPRTPVTQWTRNSALILCDYLTDTRFGVGIPYADIDEPSLEAAADVCDELVNLNPSGTEARYSIDGVFDASRSHSEIIEQMLAAMAGDLVYENGKWFIYAGEYRTPNTNALTIDDLRGQLQVTTHLPQTETFNHIRGTFVDPKADYHENDIPAIKNATYITADGETRYLDIALNFVTSSGQAQRLLKIALERSRQGITVVFPAKLTALQHRVGDVVKLTLSRYGWTDKTFEVLDSNFVMAGDGSLGVDLLLKETASGVWDWNNGEETTTDLAPNTTLPSPTDAIEPTGLTLTSGTSELDTRADGTILTRMKASWSSGADQFTIFGGTYELGYKKASTGTWSQSFTVPGYVNFHHFTDVKDGVNYDVRIRSVNSIGYASDWVYSYNHLVVGKTAAPSNVTGFAHTITDDGIKLTWTAITDLDRNEYEIRSGASWAAGTVIARIKASDGTAFTYQYRTAGSITLRIKAIDTSGIYSAADASLSVTITGPSPVGQLKARVIDASVLLDWENGTASTFSVNKYSVYRGEVFASAALIGTVFGTFHTYLEQYTGTFRYWVVAEDIGGNRSTESYIHAAIVLPSDFYAVESVDMLSYVTANEYSIVISEVVGSGNVSGKTAFFPINETAAGGIGSPWLTLINTVGATSLETWDQWFDNNGWTTWQDAIDDGFDGGYSTPGTLSVGYLETKRDFGSTLPSAYISAAASFTTLTISGTSFPITYTISTSTDDVTYTDYPGLSAFVSDFRYVKVRVDFDASSTDQLVAIYNLILEISLTRSEETGRIQALSADNASGGTVVTFTEDWYDVEDIQLTAEGTIAAYAVLNFTDIANPTTFKVLLYDLNGAALTGWVRYRVRGAINI